MPTDRPSAPAAAGTSVATGAPERSGAPAIRVEGVVKGYGRGARALDGIGLELQERKLAALIGANGSGKSTLLKILFGITSADAGTARVLGLDPARDRMAIRMRTGYAGQDLALDAEMTGWETLRLFYALRGLPHAERASRLERLAGEYGLDAYAGRAVGTYSGGQRQRLHLAIEAMHDPQLLLLDEPTASLDPNGRRALWSRLVAWRDAGHTLLVATHDLAEVEAYCDQVFLLEGGRLLASGSPSKLVAQHSRAATVISLARGSGAMARELTPELAALPGAPEVTIGNGTITLWRERNPDGNEPALDLLAARNVPFLRVERTEPDLASAYFRLTGTELAKEAPARRPGSGGGGGGGRRGG